MEQAKLRGMGWERDLPDFRDYTVSTPKVAEILTKSRRLAATAEAMLPKQDLREWCSPVEDQGDLGSCTANAGVGLLEYFERRAFGNYLDGSRWFFSKETRATCWGGREIKAPHCVARCRRWSCSVYLRSSTGRTTFRGSTRSRPRSVTRWVRTTRQSPISGSTRRVRHRLR